MLDASEREVQRLVTEQMEVGWSQPPLCVSGVSGCAVTTPRGCTALSHQPWLQVVTQDPLPHICHPHPHIPLYPQRTQVEFPTHHPQREGL